MRHATHSWSEFWADTRNVFRITGRIWAVLTCLFIALWLAMWNAEYTSGTQRSSRPDGAEESRKTFLAQPQAPEVGEGGSGSIGEQKDLQRRLDILERRVERLEDEVRSKVSSGLLGEGRRSLMICLSIVTGGSGGGEPRTQTGRWIGVLVGAVGVLTFGVLTGTIAGVVFLHIR